MLVPVLNHRYLSNKLSVEERQVILAVSNSPTFRSLPPSQIVPILADEGRYLASESTFYRVLRESSNTTEVAVKNNTSP